MTARSIRRALERKQKKLARKAERQSALPTEVALASEQTRFESLMEIGIESGPRYERGNRNGRLPRPGGCQ